MQITIYNDKQLDIAVAQLKGLKYPFNLTAEDVKKEKTKSQLGFFFGALVRSIQQFFEERGDRMTAEEIKENLYSACCTHENGLVSVYTDFYGRKIMRPKRLSEMTMDEASVFIDYCIKVIDSSPIFDGLVLHPSIRYLWVRKITADDLRQLESVNLPEKDAEYLLHTRNQCCLCCGKQGAEVHHLKVSGYTGTAFKAPDWLSIPLCHECHIGFAHGVGQDSLFERLNYIKKHINMVDFCKIRYLRWKNHL